MEEKTRNQLKKNCGDQKVNRFCKVYHGGLNNDLGKLLEPLGKWMAHENLNGGV